MGLPAKWVIGKTVMIEQTGEGTFHQTTNNDDKENWWEYAFTSDPAQGYKDAVVKITYTDDEGVEHKDVEVESTFTTDGKKGYNININDYKAGTLVTIKVTYAQDKRDINTAQADADGNAVSVSAGSAKAGDKVTVTPNTNPNYHVTSVSYKMAAWFRPRLKTLP